MNDPTQQPPLQFPNQIPPLTQAEFDEIRADASVICAALRVDIAQAQARLAEQELRINQAAFRLMFTPPAPTVVEATPK